MPCGSTASTIETRRRRRAARPGAHRPARRRRQDLRRRHERRRRQRGHRAGHARARLPRDRHQPAPLLPGRPRPPRQSLLRHPGHGRRAHDLRPHRRSLLRHQYGRGVPRGGRAAVRRRVRRGAHPESLPGVQPAREVPPPGGAGEDDRRRLPGHRALRPRRARRPRERASRTACCARSTRARTRATSSTP